MDKESIFNVRVKAAFMAINKLSSENKRTNANKGALQVKFCLSF